MNTEDSRQEIIITRALQIADPKARSAYLEKACGADKTARQRIEGLLQALEKGAEPGETANPISVGTATPQTLGTGLAEPTGAVIGRYKLVEVIGEGGYGTVYLAEQEEPVRRQVALKVIKLGMDTKQVIARFEAERQALALMDHPNIAKVFDAGATASGRPFFVMELVRGMPITDYCDRANLSPVGRLDLFIQVCQAIQHAHQKGIIHRDIKPSNILVAEQDGKAVPKVIDFGIAKATAGQALSGQTLLTAFEQFIGTPAYMSPEQAQAEGQDIDTRSDIYSLGVLLYELLTGRLPFGVKGLLEAGVNEMRRIIGEEAPPRPSTRLSTLGAEDLSTVAKRRCVEPVKLIQLVRGDLDWIVMRCLEKERGRRYGTAESLAEDLRRHLRHEPVEAAAPRLGYRMGKFVRRHRAGMATAGALVVLLFAGASVSTWQAVRASRAEQESRAVAGFLEDMLKSVSPEQAQGRDTAILREIVNKAAAWMEVELKNQPIIKARLQSVLGQVYLDLGEYGTAEPLLSKALATRERLLGKDHPDTLESVHNIGNLLYDKGDYAGAEAIFRRTLKAAELTLGRDHTNTLSRVNDLAGTLKAKGDYAGAEPLFRRALEARERTLGKDDPETLRSVNDLAGLLQYKGDYAAAEPLFRRVLETRERTLGPDHPDTICSLNDLASLLDDKSDYAAAEALLRRALEASERTNGRDHPETMNRVNSLAMTLRAEGNYAGAEPLVRRALETRERTLGKDHPDTLVSVNSLALLLLDKGDYAGAGLLFGQALETSERTLGKDHPNTLTIVHNLAYVLGEKGDYLQAEALYRRALEAQERTLGKEHPVTLGTVDTMAYSVFLKGDYVGAEALFRRAVEARDRTLGKEHIDALRSVSGLADVLLEKGDYIAAEPLCGRALEASVRTLGKEHPVTLLCVNSQALLLKAKGDYAGSEALFESALETRERTRGKESPYTLTTVNDFAGMLLAKGDYARAETMFRRALTSREKVLGDQHPALANTLHGLADCLSAQAKFAEAEGFYRRSLALYRKIGNPQHPQIPVVLKDLTEVLKKQGKLAEAEAVAH
jgi:eukaryotic-like serine/threonine-protein kinase